MAPEMNWFILSSVILSVSHLCSCNIDSHEANGVQPELRIFHQSCALKMDEGPCKALIDRFYFNVETRQCEPFQYGGCQGNANNFQTFEECEEMCVVKPDKDPCHLDDEPGPCRGLVPRYFFNRVTGACERFFYGGCFGNANNFRTKEECRAKCHKRKPEPAAPAVDISIPEPEAVAEAASVGLTAESRIPELTNSSTQPLISTDAHLPEFCFSPINKGTCSESMKRYIYNPKRKRCQIFIYSGCGGNKNNFTSKRHCMKACMKDVMGRGRIRVKKRNFNILFRSV